MFPQLASARNALAELARDFDAGALSPGEAVRVVKELGEIQRCVDSLSAMAGRRVSDTGAAQARGERSADALVAKSLGCTTRAARDAIDMAKKLDELPTVEHAVRSGKLSGTQAALIAKAACVNPDATQRLLDAAEQRLPALRDACQAARAAVEDPATRAARQQSLKSHRACTDADGMVAWFSRFTSEIGGQLNAIVDAETRRIFRERRGADPEGRASLEAYAADAVANLILGRAQTKGADVRVHVLIDHGTLTGKFVSANPTCDIAGVGPVDPEWVRSLLGSAFLTAVVKKAKDITTVAHLGRHVPVEIQTALVVRGRECRIKDCGMRGYLERDHAHDYAKGGPTALENLGWLCWYHHQLKTRGWALGSPDPKTGKCDLSPPARAA
jgi:hypothetical protein